MRWKAPWGETESSPDLPRAWRVAKAKHAATAFDGEGARLHGGRWNCPGVAMVYTSESPALAALEQLVGLDDPSALARMVLIAVDIPDVVVTDLDAAVLPPNWRSYPAPPELQRLGNAWTARRTSLALRVPTVVVLHQFNFLLNPLHEAFAALRLGDPETFELAERLLKRP